MKSRAHRCHVYLRSALAVITWGILSVPTLQAQAQSPQLSARQVELNNRAGELLRETEPDLEQARALIAEALEIGPRFDLLLLTQARIEQLLDNCSDAAKLLNEIDVAPNDPSVPRDTVLKRRDAYSSQMKSVCSAVLDVSCADPDTTLRIAEDTYSCGTPIKVQPGFVMMTAELGDQRKELDLEIEGAQTKRISISLTKPTEPEPAKTDTTPVTTSTPTPPATIERTDHRLRARNIRVISGATAVAAGGLLAAGSSLRLGGHADPRTALEMIPSSNTMLGIGTVLVVTGGGLITWGLLAARGDEPRAQFNVGGAPGAGFGSITVRF